jgi:hypothetical protein
MKLTAPTAAPSPRAEMPHMPPDLLALWKAVEAMLAQVVEEAVRKAVAAMAATPPTCTEPRPRSAPS